MSERIFRKPEGAAPSITFIKPSKLEDIGTILEGEFVQAIPSKFDEDKSDYKFKLDDGSFVIINSCGALTFAMKNVKVGDYCQVNYNGKKKIEKGKMRGKEFHDIEVLVA